MAVGMSSNITRLVLIMPVDKHVNFYVAALLQLNCNDYSSITRVWILLNFSCNVKSISNKSLAHSVNSNISRL